MVLCFGMLARVGMAQEALVPDKDFREGMNKEEFLEFREKMRMRMEKAHANENKPAHDVGLDLIDRPVNQKDDEHPGSTYGRGFDSRMNKEEKPDTATGMRPDHPRFERFNRGDRMRR